MPEETSILKNPVFSPDQDYAFLRKEGLKYIEELASKQWTDYNEHDPGITILEALCYAITELGYRTGFSMADLLREPDGSISSFQTLYTAKNILTQVPLTIYDYRKLLIDIVGVHNAWLLAEDFYLQKKVITPAGEIALFADCKKDCLSFEKTPHPIYISGLYKVLIDLEDDVQLGDLNNGELSVLNPAVGIFKLASFSFSLVFPVWDEVAPEMWKGDISSIGVSTNPTITEDGKNWKIDIPFSYTSNSVPLTATLTAKVIIDLPPAGMTFLTSDIEAFFTSNANAYTLQVLQLYMGKIQKAYHIIQNVKKTLNENRNLCEDFVSVQTIRDEEVSICCDIDVAPDADMEEVQAKVFFAIEEYLNPTVHFYLLEELIEKGVTTDEIFEGPILEHGFIDTVELEKTQLRQEIYTSDIINLLMDIPGVLAVKNFRMTKYDQNDVPVPNLTGKPWCMPISFGHKPLLSETKSKIVFYKNQFPYLPSLQEVRDTLVWLKAVNMRNKLTGSTTDIAIPSGTYSPLETYTPLAQLFPQTYGIGNDGLPPIASEERKAQATQLQTYLLLYDQLLADFFVQLKGAKSLFSTENTIQTYFAQFLDTIKYGELIYKNDGVQPLLEKLLQTQDSTVSPANDWQALYETTETFNDRRTRFLDHLMARFAESFHEYVLLMYSLDYETQQETKIDPAHVIANKIKFLQEYPEISYQRGKAYNYCPQKEDMTLDVSQLWDTDNVSGLEKKVSLLGGIENFYRRFLYCIGQVIIVTIPGPPVKYQFSFKNDAGDLLTSLAVFDTQDLLKEALPAFLTFVLEKTNYVIKKIGSIWRIFLQDDEGNNLASSNDFTSRPLAKDALAAFIEEFSEECDSEGMHLIEHVLLRPRDNTFRLLPVCLDPDCDFCGEQDPYSFRMSLVLPYWPKHFNNMAFRHYFEDLVRREAPAHTMIKICWINNESLYEFEKAYKDWVTALANYTLDPSTLPVFRPANDKLGELLYKLHSEYPVATLHDCDESKDTNPVQLGKTILGTFKN
jgi:hypothetical protein